MSTPEVLLQGVGKKFLGSTKPVLEGIDLAIERGEFVSIIGPSGCGKSTLLKLVAGLIPCSKGEIAIDGAKPDAARKLMSFVFQDATLLPWRTVEKNVALALELEGKPKAENAASTASLLELVGLSHVAKHYPRQLSGGMKMRTSIARGAELDGAVCDALGGGGRISCVEGYRTGAPSGPRGACGGG